MGSHAFDSRHLERRLAGRPADRAQLAGLQGVQHAQDFVDGAADREVVDADEADGAARVDHERRAQRDAVRLVEDAERGRQLAPGVGEHRVGQVGEGGVAAPPRQVDPVGVAAYAEQLGAALGELGLARPNSAISVGQTNVKSIGQKKTTRQRPGWLSPPIDWNSAPGSVDTTACNWKLGNLSPTVSILDLVFSCIEYRVEPNPFLDAIEDSIESQVGFNIRLDFV